MTTAKTMDADETGYIHTYTPEEQQRLMDQALFLEPYHHTGLDLAAAHSILEVGCGVGAQMRILLRRWPQAHVTGVEPSAPQIARARINLSSDLQSGRAVLHRAEGHSLPLPDNNFDAACVFWVFEHVPQPLPILRDILRVLKPAGVFYATEVFDRALYVYPACPGIMTYFQAFTTLQSEFGGDPNVGVRMPGLLAEAGFVDIRSVDVSPTLDARMSDPAVRSAFLTYFRTLLLSGSGPLIDRGRVSQCMVEQVRAEFAHLERDLSAVFSYGAKQICGVKAMNGA